jgi:hypothetical protein
MNISLLAFRVEYIQWHIWKINMKFIHIFLILVVFLMLVSIQASSSLMHVSCLMIVRA